ncbi:uncharacterized protein [Temnothorax longispinosus]|uniref:uncharacterized protein n=1 Tax=Temnothorax longispinosus TaxID=300112 RepID=UPI003A99C20B
MAVRLILVEFLKVSCNLSNCLNEQREFVEAVTNDEEANYQLFARFAGECSTTLLCVMHELGYCRGNKRLVNIISNILDMREALGHEEEDAGKGHIARFLRRNEGIVENRIAVVQPVAVRREQRRRAEENIAEDTVGWRSADRPTAAVAPNTDDNDYSQTQSASEEEEEKEGENTVATDADGSQSQRDGEVEEKENTSVEREQEEHQEQARQQHHQVGHFNFINLVAENARQFRNFRILGREASFRVRPIPESDDTVRWLENAFREIHAYALRSTGPGDYVGLSFESAPASTISVIEITCASLVLEVARFQRFLANENIAIIVYNSSNFGSGENPLYDGSELLASLEREPMCRLNIMYYERSHHYNPILNLNAAAGTQKEFCVSCNTAYRKDRGHCCSKKCPRCYATPSCENSEVEIVKCAPCRKLLRQP